MPEEYEEAIRRQVEFLIPDRDSIETAGEAANDVWFAVNDPDAERMCYVTGTRAREIYAQRQEMGAEAFRKYYRNLLTSR